jgi:hypothetical protein
VESTTQSKEFSNVLAIEESNVLAIEERKTTKKKRKIYMSLMITFEANKENFTYKYSMFDYLPKSSIASFPSGVRIIFPGCGSA